MSEALPAERAVAGSTPFRAARVATAKKAGVSRSPWPVRIRPRRAAPSWARTLNSNTWQLSRPGPPATLSSANEKVVARGRALSHGPGRRRADNGCDRAGPALAGHPEPDGLLPAVRALAGRPLGLAARCGGGRAGLRGLRLVLRTAIRDALHQRPARAAEPRSPAFGGGARRPAGRLPGGRARRRPGLCP